MKRQPIQLPQLPLHPGRGAFSRRTRLILMLTLVAVVAAVVALGALLAHSSSKPRVVTIPKADRNATAALMRAALDVHFRPPGADGAGRVENEPASAAKILTKGLLPRGAQAPDFTLRTPTGTPVSLRALRGKAVMLEFFATWCPHCNAEAPHLKTIAESFPASKYAYVSVNADSEDAASVFAYHRYFGLPFPALLDPSSPAGSFHQQGGAGPVTTKYHVLSYPTFYVIGKNGRITWRGDGEQPDALLHQELVKAANGA